MFKKIIEEYNQLDKLLILRGLAALAVVIFHAGPPRNFLHLFGRDFSWLFWVDGSVAVWTFFTLSGYLMGKSFFSGKYELNFSGVKQFFISRAKRILPLYYFVVLILITFAYNHLLNIKYLPDVLDILFFRYDYKPTAHFSNTFWTLSVEVQFYLIVPFIVFLLWKLVQNKLGSILVFLSVVSFSICSKTIPLFWRYLYIPDNISNIHIVNKLDIFLIGLTVYPILKNFPNIRQIIGKFSLFGIPIILFLYIFSSYGHYYEFHNRLFVIFFKNLLPTTTALIISIFIYITESALFNIVYKKPILKLKHAFKNPFLILEYLGTISYGLYLWHMAVLQSVGVVYIGDGTFKYYLLKFSLTFIISSIIASITYFRIEKL